MREAFIIDVRGTVMSRWYKLVLREFSSLCVAVTVTVSVLRRVFDEQSLSSVFAILYSCNWEVFYHVQTSILLLFMVFTKRLKFFIPLQCLHCKWKLGVILAHSYEFWSEIAISDEEKTLHVFILQCEEVRFVWCGLCHWAYWGREDLLCTQCCMNSRYYG